MGMVAHQIAGFNQIINALLDLKIILRCVIQ